MEILLLGHVVLVFKKFNLDLIWLVHNLTHMFFAPCVLYGKLQYLHSSIEAIFMEETTNSDSVKNNIPPTY